MLKTRNRVKQVTCTKEHLQRSRYLKPVLVDLLPVHDAGAGDPKGEELTPSVMDNPRKRIWHLQCSARITGARSVFASTSRHFTACQEQRVGDRNTDQVASCRRVLARISPIFQRGCAASRPTCLSEELATESSTFPEQLASLSFVTQSLKRLLLSPSYPTAMTGPEGLYKT